MLGGAWRGVALLPGRYSYACSCVEKRIYDKIWGRYRRGAMKRSMMGKKDFDTIGRALWKDGCI